MKVVKKTAQQKESEGLLRRVFKLFVGKKIELRGSYLSDELGAPGNKRLVIFFKEK